MQKQNSESNNQMPINNQMKLTMVHGGFNPSTQYYAGDVILTYIGNEQVLCMITKDVGPVESMVEMCDCIEEIGRCTSRSLLVSVNNRGQWQPDCNYTCDLMHGIIDMVKYENLQYLCMQSHTSGKEFLDDFGACKWKMDIEAM